MEDLWHFSFSVLRSCGNPGSPGYGVISGKNYWVGSVVRYFCYWGYTLIGPAVRRCLPSGYWSGHRTPLCKYKIGFLKKTNVKKCEKFISAPFRVRYPASRAASRQSCSQTSLNFVFQLANQK